MPPYMVATRSSITLAAMDDHVVGHVVDGLMLQMAVFDEHERDAALRHARLLLPLADPNRPALGVEVEPAFENLAIWPNPATESINVSFASTDLSDTRIRIYDILGREVLNKQYVASSVLFNEQIDVDHLTSGTYLVNIARQNANTTKRVVIF